MTNIIFFDVINQNRESNSSTTNSEISSVTPETVIEASLPLYSVIGKACLACAVGDYDGTYSIREPYSNSMNSPPLNDVQGLQLSKLRCFTYKHLVEATRLFDRSNMLGGDMFGSVFKGFINKNALTANGFGERLPVAVKRINHGSPKEVTKWLKDIRYWGRFCHPNLLGTSGYSIIDQQCLLVSEFMAQGSLADCLFKGDSNFAPLSWSHRMKIALGSAKCLVFLHESGAIHGNFKPSNILLDSDYNPKLSFGVAKESPNYVEDIYGLKTSTLDFVNEYTSPQCFLEGHPTSQGDVYSFGLVLLEMLIGRKVLQSELKLASAYKGEDKLVPHLDSICLESRYVQRDAKRALRLASRCLSGDENSIMVKVVDCLTRYMRRTL